MMIGVWEMEKVKKKKNLHNQLNNKYKQEEEEAEKEREINKTSVRIYLISSIKS